MVWTVMNTDAVLTLISRLNFKISLLMFHNIRKAGAAESIDPVASAFLLLASIYPD